MRIGDEITITSVTPHGADGVAIEYATPEGSFGVRFASIGDLRTAVAADDVHPERAMLMVLAHAFLANASLGTATAIADAVAGTTFRLRTGVVNAQ